MGTKPEPESWLDSSGNAMKAGLLMAAVLLLYKGLYAPASMGAMIFTVVANFLIWSGILGLVTYLYRRAKLPPQWEWVVIFGVPAITLACLVAYILSGAR